MPDSSAIVRDLLAALRDRSLSDEQFDSLAIRVFNHQSRHNPAYRKFIQAKGVEPGTITRWQDIPAVPTDAFKLTDHPLVTFAPEDIQKTFLTSGTTGELRGQHHFPSLDLYNESIVQAWRELALPRPSHAVMLIAAPEQAPRSSLSHMMGVISNCLAEKTTWAMDREGKLDTEALSRAVATDQPIALFGTALAMLGYLETIQRPVELPRGSWAMETGGYKGSRRRLQKEDFYQLMGQKLHLPPEAIFNEYSMTELSSQFYTRGLNQPHKGPGWTRVRIIDPVTDTDARPGEPGHLVIYDLANLHSVMAIRTQDIAIHSEPDLALNMNSFTLLGRDPVALPRGCSRAAEYHLES